MVWKRDGSVINAALTTGIRGMCGSAHLFVMPTSTRQVLVEEEPHPSGIETGLRSRTTA